MQKFNQTIILRVFCFCSVTAVSDHGVGPPGLPLSRAVPRLQIIGSPRGAAEKFDAKRVIGAAFF